MTAKRHPSVLALSALLALCAAGCAGDPGAKPEAAAPPSPAQAAPAQTAPSEKAAVGADASLNEPFLDPTLDPQEFVERFEGESREIAVARAAIAAALELAPGEEVADVGTGTGLFLEDFDRAVAPAGRVFAVDISPRLIEFVRERARAQGWAAVEPVLCSDSSVELAPASLDAAFVCDTYHHFTQPASTLASLHAALRPGGRLYVVDFERIPGVSREWVLGHVRAGKEVFRAEIEAAGFRFDAELDVEGLAENYLLRFERP